MAFGVFSTARIGAMTWGPGVDVWAAAIAISQINFGLSGKLGYKEIEDAIAQHVASKGDVHLGFDDETRKLTGTPAAVTRGFQAGAAVKSVTPPSEKFRYVVNNAEDLGYADFYNLAFRLFGFNAYSTHILYMAILSLSFILFIIVFVGEGAALAAMTLAVTALFVESGSAIFSIEVMRSFAANRFLSTLAIVPTLHVIFTALMQRRLNAVAILCLLGQAVIILFVIGARSSAQWCMVSIAATAVLISAIRWVRFKQIYSAILPLFVGATVCSVVLAGNWIRSLQFDSYYFSIEGLPHHMVWHSALLGLTVHPDWPAKRPIPEIQDQWDMAAFKLFEHRMEERGQPAGRPGAYYMREHERVMREEVFNFAYRNPLYVIETIFYYKPKLFVGELARILGSLRVSSVVFVAIAALMGVLLFMTAPVRAEVIASLFILWLASLLPILWAYPQLHTVADQIWSTFFIVLLLVTVGAQWVARSRFSMRL